MIPAPKQKELLPDYIARCIEIENLRTAYPDHKKRVRKIKNRWYSFRGKLKLIKQIKGYRIALREIITQENKKTIAREIGENIPSDLHPKKAALFRRMYTTMRNHKVSKDIAIRLSIEEVDRVKLAML